MSDNFGSAFAAAFLALAGGFLLAALFRVATAAGLLGG